MWVSIGSMRTFSHIRLLPLLLAIPAAVPGQTTAPPLDNEQVRVVYATEKPHVKGRMHQHAVNRVMIYLQAGTQEFTYNDGQKKSALHFEAGEVKWSPAGGLHSPELITAEPAHLVEVELKKPGGGKSATAALDPLKVDPKHYKLEFENDQVRVFRVKFGPHEGAPLHEHVLNRVLVCLTDQNVRVSSADGKVVTLVHKAGDATWGVPAKHKEDNLNDTPFEAVVVELR
jgi:quercetin dioxygenase-like cupin family protein